jgi:hypothetical protein
MTSSHAADICACAIFKGLHFCSSAAANLNDGASRSWVFAPLPLYWYLRDSARWCVAPSVNARTARAFLFSRHSALQYMNLSDYGSLRLRWNQEPRGPASLFCEAVAVYRFSFLVSAFASSDPTSVHLHFLIRSRAAVQKLCQLCHRRCRRHVLPIFSDVSAQTPFNRLFA